MPGKVHTHWVGLRSHTHPTATDVASGQVFLGTDGSTIYMTTSDGTTTPINGSAVMKTIILDDNTAEEFVIRVGSSDKYIEIDTTDTSEELRLGSSAISDLGITAVSDTFSVTAADSITMAATGSASLSGNVTVVSGNTLYVGEQNSVNPIHIGNGGAREVNVGTIQGTITRVRGADSVFEMSSTGTSLSVKNGQDLDILTEAGHGILTTDFGVDGDITIGDYAAYNSQELIVDTANLTVVRDASVGGNLTTTGNVSAQGNLILQGGGNLTDGSNTALTVSATGQVTRIGTSSSPSTNDVLTWNGTEWVAQAGGGGGGGATNLSGLSDVDSGLSPSNGEVLQYNSSTSVFETASVATLLSTGVTGSLSDINSTGLADNDILQYNLSTTQYEPKSPAEIAAGISLDDLADLDVSTPSDGDVVQWVNSSSSWEAVAGYSNANAISAVEGESTLDLTGTVTIDGDLTVDMGGSGNTSGKVMVGSQSDANLAAADLDSVYSVKVGTSQQIPFDAGTRVHITVAAKIVRVGNPTDEIFLAIHLEDSGSSSGATWATKNLGGTNADNAEVILRATMTIAAATSASSSERDVLMSGMFGIENNTGAEIFGLVRRFDTSTHAPFPYNGAGLEAVNLGTAFNQVRISAEAGSNAQDSSNHYEIVVKAITVDFSKGE